MQINRNKILEIISFLFFKLIYDLVYIKFTTVQFDYMNSILIFNIYRYLINWIATIIFVTMAVLYSKNNLMTFVLKSMLIFSIIPTISLFGLKEMGYQVFVLILMYWIIMLLWFFILQKLKIGKSNFVNNSFVNLKTTNLIFFVSLSITFILWGFLGNFNFIFSLSEVSDNRMALRNIYIPSIVRYIMSWVGNVLLPFCFAMYLKEKKYWKVILTFIAGFMLFSVNGLKTWLVIYPMILFVFITLKSKVSVSKVTKRMAIFASLFGIISLLLYYSNIDITIGAFFHRIFSIPAELNYDYYTFFSSNEPLLLRESIFRKFSESPYKGQYTYIIGALTAGKEGVNANNGMFGDAYANFKILGVIIYPMVISIIFKFIINVFKHEDSRVAISILLVLIWNLINASLFSWLLSGGVLIYLFIVSMSQKIGRYQNIK